MSIQVLCAHRFQFIFGYILGCRMLQMPQSQNIGKYFQIIYLKSNLHWYYINNSMIEGCTTIFLNGQRYRHVSENICKIANKNMKRHLMLLVIKKMQIKTTIRCHIISTRMTIIKKSDDKLLVKMCINQKIHTPLVGL